MTRKEAVLATGVVVLCLLAGETASRLLPPQYRMKQSHWHAPNRVPFTMPDPEIGWVLSQAPVEVPDTPPGPPRLPDVTYSIRHGQRLTSAHPQSGPVIIATGCSFTFGDHISDEDSWPWLLQERLPAYHLVNVAVNGYGTDQALLAAERTVSQFPGEVRTVVLGFGDFQIERNRSPQTWLGMIYPMGKPLFERTGNAARYKRLAKFWSFGPTIDGIADHSVVFSRAMNVFYDRIVDGIESHEGARNLTIALIKDFAQKFQERRINLVVVILPYVGDQSPQAKNDRNSVISQLRAAGISTAVPEFPRLPNGQLDANRFSVGFHPNRRYNLILTTQLAPILSGTVPAAASSSQKCGIGCDSYERPKK